MIKKIYESRQTSVYWICEVTSGSVLQLAFSQFGLKILLPFSLTS